MVIRLALARNGREYSTARAAWKLPFQATITEPNGPSPALGGAIMTARAHSWMAASTVAGATVSGSAPGRAAGHAARRTDRQVERIHGAVEHAGDTACQLE